MQTWCSDGTTIEAAGGEAEELLLGQLKAAGHGEWQG